jgi:hypothetical protein
MSHPGLTRGNRRNRDGRSPFHAAFGFAFMANPLLRFRRSNSL